MPHILIRTHVASDPEAVFAGFTAELFKKLAPPLVPMQLLRFDGCRKGDQVHLEIGAGPLKQRWEALIVEDGASDQEIYFVDEGKVLPFFLKSWRHRHRILARAEGGTEIVDDIQYESPNRWIGWLFYPVLYYQFRIRRPVYQSVFGRG